MSSVKQEMKMREIVFPPSKSMPEQSVNLSCQASIVVIGANGAGKSRLGAWLELKGPQKEKVHRVTAQRSLVFPVNTSPISLRLAEEAFHWAPRPSNWDDETYESNKTSLRIQDRYGGLISNAEIAPMNDFGKLLTLLFSDSYSKLLEHEAQQRKSDVLVPMPDTLLRKVQEVWESVLPHRRLDFLSGEVRARPVVGELKDYSASAMSDGERVIFYLIGQCLCAAESSIIVIDEPEIHLHKAIQDALWNTIEKARPDCSFVYLTHDLMFAADRIGALKVCLTDYADDEFSWFAVASQNDIPEDVYLEVLGSRKPVLFVEGTSGSHDFEIYQLCYPQFTVKPVGSCASVIAATKVFRDLREMHRNECFGIIDRDYLTQEQLEAYEKRGVFAPLVAEVENLYLIPCVIKTVADQLLLDTQAVLEQVKEFVVAEFQRMAHSHAMDVTRHKVALGMGRFSSNESSIDAYVAELRSYLGQIDAKRIYEDTFEEAQNLIKSKDYDEIIRIFNKKDLTKKIARFFNFRKVTYIENVKEMAKRGLGDIPTSFLVFLPDLVNKLPKDNMEYFENFGVN